MSTRPECNLCRRPVIRSRTVPGDADLMLDPAPVPPPAGRFELDLDHPIPLARLWRGASWSTAPTPSALYARHLDTCPKRATPADPELPDVERLAAERDALAGEINTRTHEFTPGEDPDGNPTDLCTALVPHVCGLTADDPDHRTARVVLAGTRQP